MTEQIGILGTGQMGIGLARCLSGAGYAVLLGSRDPSRSVAHAQALGGGVLPGGYADTVAGATIVIPALGFADMQALLAALGPALAGKTVVDISTPWAEEIGEQSAAERHAALLPDTARLVGAWKTTFAGLLDPAARAGVVHDVLISGDDRAANDRVAAIIGATGFRPVDCGPLATARVVEGMVRLMGPIARRLPPASGPRLPAWKFLP